MFENDVAKSIGFTLVPNILLPKQMVLQPFQNIMLLKSLVVLYFQSKSVDIIIGFTTFSNMMLLKSLVVQHSQQ